MQWWQQNHCTLIVQHQSTWFNPPPSTVQGIDGLNDYDRMLQYTIGLSLFFSKHCPLFSSRSSIILYKSLEFLSVLLIHINETDMHNSYSTIVELHNYRCFYQIFKSTVLNVIKWSFENRKSLSAAADDGCTTANFAAAVDQYGNVSTWFFQNSQTPYEGLMSAAAAMYCDNSVFSCCSMAVSINGITFSSFNS